MQHATRALPEVESPTLARIIFFPAKSIKLQMFYVRNEWTTEQKPE